MAEAKGKLTIIAHVACNNTSDSQELAVVYSYMALGGFLWTLWAVYKSALGEECGEYTLIMYRYAKRYYQKAKKIFPFFSTP